MDRHEDRHDGERLTLTQAAERFGVPVASPHHALDDALVPLSSSSVTAAALERHGYRSIGDLIAETRREPRS